MSEDQQKTLTKYVYRFSLPARSQKTETASMISEADIRAFVSEMLGVQNPWKNNEAREKK